MSPQNSAPGQLPVYEIEIEILAALSKSGRAIVQAPTGSGKSTQIPQMLVRREVSKEQIVVLQPRRLAARMLAARVAWETRTKLGDEVGYQIRFDDRSSRNTRIKYVTEGILLRHMLSDPDLGGVDTLIFDEFHERHIYCDVTLGRALLLQRSTRPDLKIVVMSATLDSDALAQYLRPCGTARSEGRAYPVEIEYVEKSPDPRKTPVWELACRELERVLPDCPGGDVLVFMPGSYEIMRTIGALRNSRAARSFEILPLHGELPPDRQDAAVARYDRRKIVVSTNVAETSLTIDGIALVVDSGLARVARFDPNRGINTLLVEKIGKASADQRAGRAGRTRAGRCLRLWTQVEHQQRPDRDTPEIHRIDLAEIALTLKATGVSDLRAFPWFEQPGELSLGRAETLLNDLGATDKAGNLTQLGRRLVAFPVHPRYAAMLVAAGKCDCAPAVALISALTQERNLLLPRQGEQVATQRERKLAESDESDFVAIMSAWQFARQHDFDLETCRQVGIHSNAARQVDRVFEYFMNIAASLGIKGAKPADGAIVGQGVDLSAVAKCILVGFSDHMGCRLSPGSTRFELVHRRRGDLSRDSSVRKSSLLVACEVREIEGRKNEVNTVLSLATAIRREWLLELFPADLVEKREVRYDQTMKRVVVEQQILFRDLAIERRQSGTPTEAEAAAVLMEEIASGRIELNGWDSSVEQMIARINLLAQQCPDLGIAVFCDDDRRAVLKDFCAGAFGYKDLRDKPILPVLKRRLAHGQFDLVERHAPERITLSNGRSAKVMYGKDGQPSISLPIQSLYGVEGVIKLAMGRAPVVVHILAPNQRAVQITQDLTGFWRNHYPQIKKEHQRKYPKHEWR